MWFSWLPSLTTCCQFCLDCLCVRGCYARAPQSDISVFGQVWFLQWKSPTSCLALFCFCCFYTDCIMVVLGHRNVWIWVHLNEGNWQSKGFFVVHSETSLVIMDRSCQPGGLAYSQGMATRPEWSFTGISSTFSSLLLSQNLSSLVFLFGWLGFKRTFLIMLNYFLISVLMLCCKSIEKITF